MFKTKICDLLGIEYPVIQGGMVWVSYHELCSAVSEAGGLSTLAGGSMTPEELRKEIILVREKTSKPFAVNIPLIVAQAEELVRVAIDEKAPVITTSAGNPSRLTSRIHEAGLRVLHVSPSVSLAERAWRAGVDAVIAEGIEAGGHNGFEEITTLTLIPQVADRVPIPVIAAGGIADARGFVAALALGAQGVQIGTRFAATYEAHCCEKFKQAIIEATDTATVITGRSFGPTRCIRNRLAERILEAEQRGVDPSQILNIIGRGRSRRASLEGDIEEGTLYCGQIAGLIREIKRAGEVVEEIIHAAAGLLESLEGMSHH